MVGSDQIHQTSHLLEKKEPVHGNHRGSEEHKNVSWLPDVTDSGAKSGKDPMVPGGPWATGSGLNYNPDSGLTGTRPVVDHYSTTMYSYKDWKDHNKMMLGMTADKIHRINMAEYNGRRGLECVSMSADKNQQTNTERTLDKMHELVVVKSEVERALHDISFEIDELENNRRRLDNARKCLLLIKSISSECLSRRSMREGKDLSMDQVQQELIKESGLVKEVSDLYIKTLEQIADQQERNHSMKARLEGDWSDKQETWRLMTDMTRMKTTSQSVMFKPAANRFTENQLSEEGWAKANRDLLATSDAVKSQSAELRSMIAITILGGCATDLKAQADNVDIALARQVSENDVVIKTLYKELEVVALKNAEIEKLIYDLQQGLRSLDPVMKVAQSRLDNLHQRPRAENCRDHPQFGLVDEVKAINDKITLMREYLQEAEDSLLDLIKNRGILEKEIQTKLKTLYIDKERCQVMRGQYPSATELMGH